MVLSFPITATDTMSNGLYAGGEYDTARRTRRKCDGGCNLDFQEVCRRCRLVVFVSAVYYFVSSSLLPSGVQLSERRQGDTKYFHQLSNLSYIPLHASYDRSSHSITSCLDLSNEILEPSSKSSFLARSFFPPTTSTSTLLFFRTIL